MKKQIPEFKELTPLKMRIKQRNETYAGISCKTGIPTSSLSKKVNGRAFFDISEVSVLCDVLEINPAEIPEYFIPERC